MRQRAFGFNAIWKKCFAVASLFLMLSRSSAIGAEFPRSDLWWGKTISKVECGSIKDAAWIEHQYGTECIRYYPSPNVENAEVAVISFHGDLLNGSTVWYPNNSEEAQYDLAEKNAKVTKVPWIKVGRPGAYGSSGDHTKRRLPKEMYSLNEAVSLIKDRFGIKQLILVGQSGGGGIAFGLLTLGRQDVKCAVGGSGAYVIKERAAILQTSLSKLGADMTGYRDPYDPIEHVAEIKSNARMFIIGDPRDTLMPFALQVKFAEQLRQLGKDVTVIEGRATDLDHHGLERAAFRTAGWCAADLLPEEITAKVKRLTEVQQ